jgi:hypothetical protein
MMAHPRYRFMLPDGQIHESEAGLAAIRRAHPAARVTHRVQLDEGGRFLRLVPFTGKQPGEEDEESEESAPADAAENAPAGEAGATDAPADTEKPAPAEKVTRAGRKDG